MSNPENNSGPITERDLGDESLLTDDITDLLNSFSLSANDVLLQKTDKIQSDVDEIKHTHSDIKANYLEQNHFNKKMEVSFLKLNERISKVEDILIKHEQSNEYIIKMLEQLIIQSNQRFSLTKRNISEYRSNLNEKPLDNKKLLLTESDTLRFEKTRDELNFNHPDSIDKIRSEKNRGKIQIGQWCNEINVGTTDDAPALITATDHISSTISVNSNTSQENENLTNSNSIDCEFSHQLTTINLTNENLLFSKHQDNSTEISLVHPLKEGLRGQTDRGTILTDYTDQPPVFIVHGNRLPDDTKVQLAMICQSEKGSFYSPFKFYDKKDGYKESHSCSIKLSNSQPQTFALKNLKVYKRCNNNMKKDETFKLYPYPSGDPQKTIINSLKQLQDEYRFDRVQLAIRFFKNNKLLLNGYIFYSNFLFGSSKIQYNPHSWQVSIQRPYGNQISFDCNNECQMEFLIEIPKAFHCTLKSGYKWIEISIITNDHPSSIYFTNTNYVNIQEKSFKMTLKILKQTLSELIKNENILNEFHKKQTTTNSSIAYDISENNINSILNQLKLNNFQIQFRLIHCENSSNQSFTTYDKCQVYQTHEFIEVIHIGQKRPSNEIIGLPIYKAIKTSN